MPIEKFGRYEIKSEIGRGGMATVYHAYDPNFERDVAIKVLPQAFLHDLQFRERFEREAKMIASLEHPAIVPVYDFGEEDGQPYIVMRFMAGGSLAEQLRQVPLSLEDTSRIISRLAPALDAAHARDIIHRDLKPGNVLFDQYGIAFLSDFGIARIVQESSATLTGESVIGTPAYMSPEQIKGEKTIDGRSDTYALGVLIFQMLTGQVPYRSETSTKVMMMHVLEPVPDVQETRTDLPLACTAVIAKAMAKDPEDRFATTGELAIALERASRDGETAQITRLLPQDDQTLVAETPLPSDETGTATAIKPSKPYVATEPIPGAKLRRSPLLIIGVILLVIVCGGTIVISGLAYVGRQGMGPLAMMVSPTTASTSTPTETIVLPTGTPEIQQSTAMPIAVVDTPTPPEPTATYTELPQLTETSTSTPVSSGPVIGGADKIAFISEDDIWVANLDGSELTPLTEDGTIKTNLQWTPDGKAIVYISGNCAQSVQIEDGRIDIITCFNFVDFFTSFELSPDGKQVAVSLDNQLYIVPYDLDRLNQVQTRTDLSEMAECADFAPYVRNFVKLARWSNDGAILAVELIANLGTGVRADVIQLIPVDACIPNPRPLDNFPPPRFEMKGYEKNPVIQNYDWEGIYLFALTNNVRNDGFGDLYIYNTDLHKAREEVNPVDEVCCYRDPHWSPDGSHLVLAYQNYLGGANSVTHLYLIPYGTIGTGAQYSPLPLPEITNPREKPQPILRPVQVDE